MTTATANKPTTRTDRINQAKTEYAAWKAWNTNGRKGPEPTTANIESIRKEEAMPTTTTTRTPKTPKVPVRFYANARPLGDHSNTLAHVAVRSTKGCGPDGDKLDSSGLRELLAKNGIDEVRSTWAFELPNGKIIGAVVEGDDVPAGFIGGPPAPKRTVNVEQLGARSFAVMVDGEQVGTRHRSLKAAKVAAELA